MGNVCGKLGEEINEALERSEELWKNKKYKESIALLEETWDKLPNTKLEYDESFLIVWGILDTAILIKDIEKMNKWVDKIFVADPERGDYGERELWAGKVAYESGNFEKAKEYLEVSYKKSRGRCFGHKDDQKYLQFIKK